MKIPAVYLKAMMDIEENGLFDLGWEIAQEKAKQYVRKEPKQKRNDLCKCGSKIKYKLCCGK